MDRIAEDASDDEIYARFVSLVDGRDLGDGVIEVMVQEDEDERRVELLITKAQLREIAWADVNIFDDRFEEDVASEAPVNDGLNAASFFAEEMLATLGPDEGYVVLHDRTFWRSVRAELPPVRGTADDAAFVPGGTWSAYSPLDPRYGEPGPTFGPPPSTGDPGRDLDGLLAWMAPVRDDRLFVYCTSDAVPDGLEPVVVVREREGLTLVVEQAEADRLGLAYDYVAAMVTLQVRSALAAVGLTAAVATALSEHGISCNVVAGFHHDHLFVPHERGWDVLEVLEELSEAARGRLGSAAGA